MARIITPHRLKGRWEEQVPLINDNFEKMATNAESFSPVDTTEGNCGGYIPPNYLLVAISVVFDKPDYQDYSAFLPLYDIYIDHPVSTGTLSIDNTGSGSPITVNIGDRFIANEDTTYLAGDVRARYWYATSSTTVLAGGTGSVNCIAESVGTRYNKSSYQVYYASTTFIATRKFINLYPTFGGSGSSEPTTYSVTASGGTDVIDDSYLYPNGSNVTANMAKITVGSHLSISSNTGLYTITGEDTRTDPKTVSTLSIKNKDASTHTYYVRARGILLSGKT